MSIKKIIMLLKYSYLRYKSNGINSAYIAIKSIFLNLIAKIQNRYLTTKVMCPCCGWQGHRFLYLDCGWFIVPQVECPHCKAHERHRFLYLYLQRCPPFFLQNKDKTYSLLHFAPEPHFQKAFEEKKSIKIFYTDYSHHRISELKSPKFVADIHHLPILNNTFDGIVCLHVLEHVKDDKKALKELARILHPEGELMVMVPFMMDQKETIEYGAPRSDIFDHVRGYSPLDFKDRLIDFEAKEIKAEHFLTPDEIELFKIPNNSQVLYVCKKKHIDY